MSDNPPENLLASHGTTPATKLPDDPAARELPGTDVDLPAQPNRQTDTNNG